MTATENDMKVRALSPWFGSKRTLAARIIAELGPHRAYWEPFCGSMAVLLAKPHATMETVNDLHGDLINLARVVQHDAAGPRLYRRLRRVMLSREAHQESADRIRQPPPPPPPNRTIGDLGGETAESKHRRAAWDEQMAAGGQPTDTSPAGLNESRAFDYFVASWFGRNGVAGTSNYNAGFCARYTKNGGHAAKRFTSAVESIPAWRRRMRNVTVLSDDGFKLLERIEDAPAVVIYCDPPYLVKGAKYVHDFAEADHARLATLLRRFRRTRVVTSYYDHPHIRDLYQGWTFVECPTTKAMVNQGMRDRSGSTKAPRC